MHPLLQPLQEGNIQALARSLSLVENEAAGYKALLYALPHSSRTITGITGAPGAGKSTLADALIGEIIKENKSVAVLCIDPASPFHHGALLGDRLRMSSWYNHPAVFIRSLSSRGALGGLCPKVIEITDVLKAAPFDHIIIETVGVGQNEVEIAALADTTVVVYVPEGGDEIQTLKAGLAEIADIFVVNKADRPGAGQFVSNLQASLAYLHTHKQPPVVLKTVASTKNGVGELYKQILLHGQTATLLPERRIKLLVEKAYQLVQYNKMKTINRDVLQAALQQLYDNKQFNLYRFIQAYI